MSTVQDSQLGRVRSVNEGQFSADFRKNLIFTGLFFIFFIVQLLHHQLWRDELNAWGLAVSSSDLSSLVSNVHVEGHPLLWYLILWLPSRFTANPTVLKFVEAAVGLGIYIYLGLRSPFSRFEKLLIFLGYFVVFEYTVMSRMYGLCFLLLLIYLDNRVRYPNAIVGKALSLGLMAFADAVGVILSCALVCEYLWPTTYMPRPARKDIPFSRVATSVAIFLSLLALSVWSALPSPDVSRSTSHPFGYYAADFSHFAVAITNAVVLPWLPIQHGFVTHYWGLVDVQLQLIVLVPAVLVAYWLIFRRQSNLLLLIGLTTLASIAFNHLVYDGLIRHIGVSFLAFLGALWIQRSNSPSLSKLSEFMLGLSVIAGLLISVLLWTRPFSNAETASHWLQSQHLDQETIIGTRDFALASIAEVLQRPVYFLDCNCSDTFLRFAKRRDGFQWDQVPKRLDLARKNLGVSRFIFISCYRLSEDDVNQIALKAIRLSKLVEFPNAGVIDEDYFIYRAEVQ